MKSTVDRFVIQTHGRGTYDITSTITKCVDSSGVRNGVVTVMVQHTSASLIIYENADRTARVDLEEFFRRLVPDGADWYRHDQEGPDDMASHLRMVLTRTSECIPVQNGRLCLGTWQGIYLYEHRTSGHERSIVVATLGTA